MFAMMLVRFYGNLGLKIEKLRRDPKNRRLILGKLLIPFRNIFVSLWKLIVGVLSIVIGLAWFLVGAVLYLFLCWEYFVKECISYNMMVDGLGVIGEGILEIADIGRTLTSTDNFGTMRWYAKRVRYSNRLLTQAKSELPPENGKVDCSIYPEKESWEVLAAVLKEAYNENRRIVNLNIATKDADLYLRQGYITEPGKPLTKEERIKLDNDSWDYFVDSVKSKTLLYRSRIKRSVCGAAWSFNNKLEKEINPEKWEGEKLAKYKKLKEEAEKGDANKKAEAKKKMQEMIGKYDPKKEESKKLIGTMMMNELNAYGVTKNDLSSQFTTSVIKAAMMKYGKDKMVEVEKLAPSKAKDEVDLQSVQKNLKTVDNVNLEDDSSQVSSTVNTVDDETEEDAKKITKEGL